MPSHQGTTYTFPFQSCSLLLLLILVAGCAPSSAVVPKSESKAYSAYPSGGDVIPPYTDEELRAAASARLQASPIAGDILFEGHSSETFFGPVEALESTKIVAVEDLESTSPELINVSVNREELAVVEPAVFDASALASRLDVIAASSEDPVPAQFARALMPLIGYPLDGGPLEVDDFQFRTDLTEAERQLLHETASFSGRTSERLASGEPARHVLEDELTRLLEAIGDPEPFAITFATLINEVRGLGDFSPRRTNKFIKGANHDVRLYMDFEGVHWGFDGTNWSTELEIQIHVMKSDGYRVFSTGWESVRDSRARRVGVFAWSSFTLADDLEIGTYAIKIRVRQPETNHLAEHILPFEIVSRLAQGE